jgi:Mrp family chromosome partitioning ATPase
MSTRQSAEDTFGRLSAGIVGKPSDTSGSAQASAVDRRTEKREVAHFPVQIEAKDGQCLVANTMDLSEGGMRLECPINGQYLKLDEGEIVKVALNSPFLAARDVRVVEDFRVLSCDSLGDTMRLRLQHTGVREGSAPSMSGLQPHEFVMSAELEDMFMQTQTQVNLQLPQAGSKVLVFSGAESGAGTSTISWWFAVCLARTQHRRVLFVDGNVQARNKSPSPEPLAGFVDLLLGQVELDNTVVSLGAGAPHLLNVGKVGRFTSGEISPTNVRETFARLREHYDYVIVDAPPAADSPLTLLWCQAADGCMLVLESGKSQRDDAQAAVARLRQSGALVLGAMLNKV